MNNAFERALVFMHKMPRIWLDYTGFLMRQKKITRSANFDRFIRRRFPKNWLLFSRLRRVFDRALRALPITQHERIWKVSPQIFRPTLFPTC